MVSFCFSFSGEFWPTHRYEVMIRSRRNEKEMKEHEEEQRSQGFFIKYKKNEDCFAIFLTLNFDLTLAVTHQPQICSSWPHFGGDDDDD